MIYGFNKFPDRSCFIDKTGLNAHRYYARRMASARHLIALQVISLSLIKLVPFLNISFANIKLNKLNCSFILNLPV